MRSQKDDKLSSQITASGWSILFFAAIGVFISRIFALLDLLIISICGAALMLVSFIFSRYGAKITANCYTLPPKVRCYDNASLIIKLESRKKVSRVLDIKNIFPENPDVNPAVYVLEPQNRKENKKGASRTGGNEQLAYQIQTTKRGNMNFGPLVFQYSDPFGVVKTTWKSTSTCTLLVHPYIYPLTPPSSSLAYDALTKSEYISQGSEFHSLKDYRPGDDLKLIHWTSSARRGNLLIRQNVSEVLQTSKISIFLDNRPGVSEELFEKMVSAAASLAHTSHLKGDDVLILAADGSSVFSSGDKTQDFLATIELMAEESEAQALTHSSINFITQPQADVSISILGKLHPEDEKSFTQGPAFRTKTRQLLVLFNSSIKTGFPALQVPSGENFKEVWDSHFLDQQGAK